MNITAIISEYNPFHNGHKYHIDVTKKETNCEGLIIVLSGNFVQRGTPALLNKFKRTKDILENGADLVIELPSVYAVSSAEFFARGAISLLDQLSCVNTLSFGSEEGSLEILNIISSILIEEPEEYKIQLKKFLDNGLSFPKARECSLNNYLTKIMQYNNLDIESIISKSNNILSVEYLKSLKILNSSIKPITVRREGGSYNSLNFDYQFCSASAIRNYIYKEKSVDFIKKFVPDNVFNTLKYEIDNISSQSDIFPFIKYKALVNKIPFSLPDAKDGLDNRIINKLYNSSSLDELLNNIQTKRYANTRITRLLTQYFIGFEGFNIEELRKSPCPHARILGFNSKGKEILKIMKKNSDIPIITKFPKTNLSPHLSLDLSAAAAYSMVDRSTSPIEDYITSPIILD